MKSSRRLTGLRKRADLIASSTGEWWLVAAGPPPPDAGAPPVASPEDDGDVAAGVICTTPDCGHMASAHANTDAGENTGACAMEGCDCAAMAAAADVGAAPEDAMAGDVAAPALNAPPVVPGGQAMGPAFTMLLVIEGQPTGDGREIAAGALSWRSLPIPLMGLATETHDPNGFDLNDPAVLVGRIDTLERVPGEGATQVIMGHGFFLANDDGMYFAELVEGMGRMGVSADIAVVSSEITGAELDDTGFPVEIQDLLTEGVIMGGTVCPFPAFEGAYIVLGDGVPLPPVTPIPQEAGGPVVPALPPDAVVAGGQLVHLMTFAQCVPCDRGLEVIVASGAGPVRPPAEWFADPAFTVGDGRLVEILDRRGKRALGGRYACPLTVTDEGRVFGHLAPWDVCHIGQPGCVTAPHSQAGYAYFLRGHVVAADGTRVRVGTLTCDAGHASTARSTTSAAAMAHYDDTATGAADVAVGEDEFGVWVAGAMRSDATVEQIRKLRASSVSGDWRAFGGGLELIAALSVPVPGFPIAVVVEDQQELLVAAGASVMHRLKHPVEGAPEGDVVLRRALRPMLAAASASARERLARLR